MKRYTFKVIVTEGNDEFWESLGDSSGIDEVTEWIADSIFPSDNVTVKLVKYENIPDKINGFLDGYEQLTF
ncbi:MAG: hypothetical protein PHN69_05025 [Candidatus Pacebacteria bacterium]|nr:hypothetical protein [Candidatus Paceibacterota bacterium]